MINTYTKNGQIYAKVSDLKLWDKNPRTITEKRYEDLDKQLHLGQYRPLLVISSNDAFNGVVIGGNQRLRKYGEKGIEDTPVSVIEPVQVQVGDGVGFVARVNGVVRENPKVYDNVEAMMMEYALSDNDHVGVTDIDAIANLMPEFDIDWDLYHIETGEGIDLGDYQFNTIHGDSKSNKGKDEDDTISKWKVSIECEDAGQAESLAEELRGQGYRVKVKGEK